MHAIKRSANKFAILTGVSEDVLLEDPVCSKFKKVDKFLFLKIMPTKEERCKWGRQKNEYFEKQWKAMMEKNKTVINDGNSMDGLEKVEEVYHDTASFLSMNEIGEGMRGKEKGGVCK